MLGAATAQGQSNKLSPEAEISLITCGPWQGEVYTAFGHTAIRVNDPVNRFDAAYNYGVFDFGQPNFYINYTKGLLLFELGVYNYSDFIYNYSYYNRSVVEQVLNLSPSQKQALFDYLQWNALPENKTYRYDYFFNNCSSKVRDVIVEVLGDSLKFDDSYIKTDYTIRQLTDLYLKQQPWGDLGIDICLGLPMDKHATPYEYMFLPDYLESSFDHATLTLNGKTIPAVKVKQAAYTPVPEEPAKTMIHPWVVFGLLFLIISIITFNDLRRKKLSKWLDLGLFIITGLLGLLLILLWTATDHQAAAKNFNILWALPTNLFVVLIYRQKSAEFLKKYFTIAAIIYTIVLISWFFLPQQLHIFLLPLVGGLLFRAYAITRLL
ncbi:MAG: DUF4105 domain-containing protein [Cyclobacteriaceae bacterium]|nr:DUF4105 domain-containing protein [Cyclobacteriaceae bacterium]